MQIPLTDYLLNLHESPSDIAQERLIGLEQYICGDHAEYDEHKG